MFCLLKSFVLVTLCKKEKEVIKYLTSKILLCQETTAQSLTYKHLNYQLLCIAECLHAAVHLNGSLCMRVKQILLTINIRM